MIISFNEGGLKVHEGNLMKVILNSLILCYKCNWKT